jgi:rod shape-determining protein MreD
LSTARRWGFWILVAALVVAHFVLHVGFGIGRRAPDLLTIGLLLAVREVGLGTAATLGLVFGLLEDALSVLAFGANAVAMTLVGMVGAFTRDLFVGDSRVFVISYFFVGKWMRDFVHWVMVGEGLRQPFMDQVVIQGVVGALYGAVVGFVVLELVGPGRQA